ncbi:MULTISPECIES: sugar phosphate isomerase/epimerase family protein [Niastella]|uniref:Sugar phosphate isomerase/epimerase n=1 Tax=Niastella soli TaxID=2821487 RepID=A0ABS3Z5U7_9BACT|nr:sugar phosphate isomerase/epimerase [Niastella soli]MBO9205518.1 sugar phosphate isomerase/epimerase [Niastella soli]
MPTRRDFIYKSSLATASVLFASPLLADLGREYKMGLQLYTIRDAMARNAAESIKQIAAMGYQDTETYGYDPLTGSYYGYKAKDFLQLLTQNGVSTTSGHYDLFKYLNTPEQELLDYVDKCIEGAHILQQKYITWPWLDPADRTMDKFKLLATKLNLIGERITKSGLGFAYHNHDFEFIDHNGTNGYEVIIKETDPQFVKLQVDLYWVCRVAAISPAALFRKQPGRFVMWHIKDMDKVSKDYTEMGNGAIDYTKILPDAKLSGLQFYYIEQGGNFKKSSMESIQESARFFKKNLQDLL